MMQSWSKEDLQKQDLAIRQMLKSEGWKYLEAMLESEDATAYQMLMKASDHHLLAQATGALRAIRGIKDWPLRTLEIIKRNLEDQYMP